MLNFLKKNLTGLIFGILVICFVIGFYIFAWTEPTSLPPGGNVAAPLNTSGDIQSKQGPLYLPSLHDTVDPNYFVDPQGSAAGYSAVFEGHILATSGYIWAGSYKSSDGSSGLTKTIQVVYYQSGYGTCTMTFKNGLLTATNCPQP